MGCSETAGPGLPGACCDTGEQAAGSRAARAMSSFTASSPGDVAHLHGHATGGGGFVGSEDDLVAAERVLEAGERHVLALLQRFEERLELRLIRVVSHIAAIDWVDAQFAPLRFVERGDFVRVELAIEEAAFAAHKVGVEVVGLEAVDDAGALADAAVLEFDEADRGGGILVAGEIRVRALLIERGHFLHFAVHAHEQGVHGVAAGAEQAAATAGFLLVPAVLAIPRAHAVVVVHLAVMHPAEHAVVDHALHGDELPAVADFEAHAGLHAGLLHGAVDLHALLPCEGDGFFQNEVLPSFGGLHGELGVVPGIAGDVHHFEIWLCKECRGIGEALHRGAVFGAQFRVIQRAAAENAGDLRLAGGLECGNVSGSGPAVTDDAGIVDFCHK